MIEVVIDVGPRFDEAEPQALGDVEVGLAVPRLVDRQLLRQLRDRRAQVGDAERDVLQGTLLARALGVEERQLAAPGVRADEREPIGVLDHMHADMRGHEVRNRLAVGHPEGDMVEGERSHKRAAIPIRGRATESSCRRRRAAAAPCSSSSVP